MQVVSHARSLRAAAAVTWLIAYAVMIYLLVADYMRPLPYGVYADAGRHWLQRKPLYDLHNIDGFQYFPPAAIVFAPFASLGTPWGDMAWRAANWFALAFGMWRVARKLQPERPELCWALATGLAVASSTGSLGNGQANLALAALALHVAVDLIERRWWRASALLAFGVGLKPLMAVLLLLAAALYRPLSWRVPLALAAVFGLPFLLRDHAYVARQYSDCLIKLRLCAEPDRLFEDLRSLLATLDCQISFQAYTIVRAVAALGVLALAWYTRHTVAEPEASILLATYAGSYLMLFNPRTLSSSYVMVVAPASVLAARYILDRRWSPALALSAILLCWTVNYRQLPWIQHWLRPVACIAFWGMLGWVVERSPKRAT